jgi:hypothetical protein
MCVSSAVAGKSQSNDEMLSWNLSSQYSWDEKAGGCGPMDMLSSLP